MCYCIQDALTFAELQLGPRLAALHLWFWVLAQALMQVLPTQVLWWRLLAPPGVASGLQLRPRHPVRCVQQCGHARCPVRGPLQQRAGQHLGGRAAPPVAAAR